VVLTDNLKRITAGPVSDEFRSVDPAAIIYDNDFEAGLNRLLRQRAQTQVESRPVVVSRDDDAQQALSHVRI
jgi:hypothetical protein